MPRAQHVMDGLSRAWDLARVPNRKEQLGHAIVPGEEAREGVGNKDGVLGNFRLAEGIDPLAEGPDHGERQTTELDLLADGLRLRAIERVGEGLGDDGYFVTRPFVSVFKEAAGEDVQIADIKVLPGHAQHQDVALLAAGYSDAIMELHHRRRRADPRHQPPYGV